MLHRISIYLSFHSVFTSVTHKMSWYQVALPSWYEMSWYQVGYHWYDAVDRLIWYATSWYQVGCR